MAQKSTKSLKPTKTTKKAVSSDTPKKLTKKQNLFCKYIAAGYSATQAALKAGYSARSARSIACENLTKPNVREKAKKDAETAQEKFEYTRATHFLELKQAEELAKKHRDMTAYLKAIVQKGKLFGLYVERQEVAIKEPRRFVFEVKK